MLVKVTRAIFQTPFEVFARSLETFVCWGGGGVKAEVLAGKIFMRVEKVYDVKVGWLEKNKC
jgi:hypothetical protein